MEDENVHLNALIFKRTNCCETNEPGFRLKNKKK